VEREAVISENDYGRPHCALVKMAAATVE